MNKIRIAIIGFGNVGKHVLAAVQNAPDMELAGIVRREGALNPPVAGVTYIDESTDIATLGRVDVAILCKPTRQIEAYATKYLSQGIHTVDSFDIHENIVALGDSLRTVGQTNGSVAIIAAGWDPGSDSVVRALLEAAAPVGITHTNFGPGMSMGHSVVVKSKPGVADALSLTIPLGTGIHRRVVYVQLEPGADIEQVTTAIKTDDYFSKNETHVIPVPDVSALADAGHGVNMVRKGRSAASDNQLFTFDMRVNNPALTAQVMASCARATTRQQPGAYTMIEIPMIDLLAGNRAELITRLV